MHGAFLWSGRSLSRQAPQAHAHGKRAADLGLRRWFDADGAANRHGAGRRSDLLGKLYAAPADGDVRQGCRDLLRADGGWPGHLGRDDAARRAGGALLRPFLQSIRAPARLPGRIRDGVRRRSGCRSLPRRELHHRSARANSRWPRLQRRDDPDRGYRPCRDSPCSVSTSMPWATTPGPTSSNCMSTRPAAHLSPSGTRRLARAGQPRYRENCLPHPAATSEGRAQMRTRPHARSPLPAWLHCRLAASLDSPRSRKVQCRRKIAVPVRARRLPNDRIRMGGTVVPAQSMAGTLVPAAFFFLAALVEPGAAQQIAADPSGPQTYEYVCGGCHQPTGLGVPGAFPPLAGHVPGAAGAGRSRTICRRSRCSVCRAPSPSRARRLMAPCRGGANSPMGNSRAP